MTNAAEVVANKQQSSSVAEKDGVKAKVLVLDDLVERQHELMVILNFLGEQTVALGTSGWRQKADAQQLLASEVGVVILGDSNQKNNLDERIRQILEWHAGVPIILMGENQSSDAPQADRAAAVITRLQAVPNYSTMLDMLHRARIYREQFRSAQGKNAEQEKHR